ncbi:MAG: sugar ABC transporter permease [Anaerolineaceae bacterium]|nr:sugar ABC transporter permease [Anaerolineaceae bacterium]
MSKKASQKNQKKISNILVNGTLILIVLLWTIPTIGLLVSSFRTRDAIATSGWWTVLPHREWTTTSQIQLDEDTDLNAPIVVNGVAYEDDALRDGVALGDGTQIKWQSRRNRIIDVQEKEWAINSEYTLQNYKNVMTGKTYEYVDSEGNAKTEQGDDMSNSFLNTVAVSIPATIIPILIAAFAAYGFAWMKFPGRKFLFTTVVALLVVPLQLALIPILRDFVALNLNGTYLAVWLAHAGFGLPLATYLLYNYISSLPRDILESAFIDGASHFTIFTRLILPLSVPALASFAIFQFLWVWNDYLVALVFIGAKPDVQVMTMRLAEMVGSRGQDWHVLTSGAFITMILPLVVFFSLQRFFVRGLMAGSVKG